MKFPSIPASAPTNENSETKPVINRRFCMLPAIRFPRPSSTPPSFLTAKSAIACSGIEAAAPIKNAS